MSCNATNHSNFNHKTIHWQNYQLNYAQYSQFASVVAEGTIHLLPSQVKTEE